MITLYNPVCRQLEASKDGDFNYPFKLAKLGEYSPDLRVVSSPSLDLDIRTYCRLGLTLARRRYGLPIPRLWTWLLSQYYHLPASGPAASGADAMLVYERYPKRVRMPVIWITAPTDVQALRARGVPESEIQLEISFKREVNAKAAATLLTTPSKKRDFDAVIQPTRETRVIPFFQPVASISNEHFEQKWSATDPLKLLFIGRGAKRKGLPLVLDAYKILQQTYPAKVSLHVVSSLSDGAIEIPQLPGLTYQAQAPHTQAVALMRDAHYLLMPSSYETYGWVYIEAMAQGTIPLASDTDVQRDLLDNGRSGYLVKRDAAQIVSAVAQALDAPDAARDMACRALQSWKLRYAPEVVAHQLAAVARSITTHG
jgi:glycosyltransferase involved in cell wall biosynthesis